MTELLLEIYSEEIPSNLQLNFIKNCRNLLIEFLTTEGIPFNEENIHLFISSRRVTIFIDSLPLKYITTTKARKGPSINADSSSINGFLKSLSLSKVNQLDIVQNKKGVFYFSKKKEEQINLYDKFNKIIPFFIHKMISVWKVSIRYSKSNIWIRPVRNVLCIFNQQAISIECLGLISNNKTRGRITVSNKYFNVKNFDDYKNKLSDRYIVFDHVERKKMLKKAINEKCKALNLLPIDDINSQSYSLIDEVAGSLDYPFVGIGKINKKFMDLPSEVLISTIKLHQKYFCLKDTQGNISSYFIFASNVKITKKIITDTEKIVSTRLNDAAFFIQEDLQHSFIDRYQKLRKIVFQKELGSFYHKIKRIEIISKFISIWIPYSKLSLIKTLSLVSKNDLTTKIVEEFPNLQGIIGGYYSNINNISPEIGKALCEQYLPKGNSDVIPTTPLGILLSLSDKIDNICGFFLINKIPTSSKDPFALRRDTIGIIRTIFENQLSIPLKIVINKSISTYFAEVLKERKKELFPVKNQALTKIISFFSERLRFFLNKNLNLKTEVVNLIIEDVNLHAKAISNKYNLIIIIQKAIALNKFMQDAYIVSTYKRVVNILEIEEKKECQDFNKMRFLFILLKDQYERNLYKKVKEVKFLAKKLIRENKYEEYFSLLSSTKNELDQFFLRVTINCEKNKIRINRLVLLTKVKDLFNMAIKLK